MLLKEKNVVVTGCNRGIGRAVLERFAAHGANLWALVRTRSAAFEAEIGTLAERCGVEIRPIEFDLSDASSIQSAVKEILSAKRPVDVLVNNAGAVSENALFQMTPISRIRELFEVNFFGPMLLTQLISRVMTRRKSGSIIFLSSVAVFEGDFAQAEYIASKAAVSGAVKRLARELGPSGIRVNAVAPGLVRTEMGDGMASAMADEMIRSTSFGRRAEPEEIAETIAFLASDLSSYITGQTLRVDGGMR